MTQAFHQPVCCQPAVGLITQIFRQGSGLGQQILTRGNTTQARCVRCSGKRGGLGKYCITCILRHHSIHATRLYQARFQRTVKGIQFRSGRFRFSVKVIADVQETGTREPLQRGLPAAITLWMKLHAKAQQ